MTSASTSLDRATANRINPIIGTLFTEDTLETVAHVVSDIGYLLCQIEHPPEGAEPRFGSLYIVCNCISSAIRYELENPRHSNQTKGAFA